MNNYYDNREVGFVIFLASTIVLILVWYGRRFLHFELWSDLNSLHQAISENNTIKSIRLIEKDPAAINVLHPVDGYSAFMRACLNGNTQLVYIMLRLGGDINLKSRKGETPFYLAAFYHIRNPKTNNATCIRALYYAGSDINATNDKGYAAIHLAANFGHANLVKWLISKGASTALQPYPYHMANKNGHTTTASLLRNFEFPAID